MTHNYLPTSRNGIEMKITPEPAYPLNDREAAIDKLWISSIHGTWREDVETAYNAGAGAERERIRDCFRKD